MKTLYFVISVIALIAPELRASFAGTDNRVYVQAAGFYAFPGISYKKVPGGLTGWPSGPMDVPSGSINGAPGGAIAIGFSLARHHAIELDAASFNADTDVNLTDKRYADETKLKFRYYMVTYKYMFRPESDERVKFFVGLSAGVMNLNYDRLYTFDYQKWIYPVDYISVHLAYRSTGSDQAVGGGLQIGAAYEFTRHSALNFSAKLLYMGETKVTTSGGTFLLQIGYQYSF